MSPIKSNLINRSHETNAHYVSIWERLPDALNRIITQTEIPKDEAQKALCQAISDGAIGIRCKLERQATSQLRSSNAVLDGTYFHIPTEIKPEDLDWERSRPTKPWAVGGRLLGHLDIGFSIGLSSPGPMLRMPSARARKTTLRGPLGVSGTSEKA